MMNTIFIYSFIYSFLGEGGARKQKQKGVTLPDLAQFFVQKCSEKSPSKKVSFVLKKKKKLFCHGVKENLLSVVLKTWLF